MDGNTDDVIRNYVQQNMRVNLTDKDALNDPSVRRGNGAVRFENVSMVNAEGAECTEFLPGNDIHFDMTCIINEPIKELMTNVAFRSGRTRDIVTTTGRIKVDISGKKPGDRINFRVSFPTIALRPGVFETYYWLGDSRTETAFDVVDNLLPPLVIQMPPDVNPLYLVGYVDLPFKFEQ